jgi:phospholipid/cholesterol/gamma-HCH transport system substrate-binding protein
MNTTQLRWYSLRVGIVVLVGLVIFVFVVSVVGTEQNIFTAKYSLKVFMPNVQGLVNGAMVSLGGLKIGYVKEMEFKTREGMNGVEVTLDITTKYRASITTSSVGQIKTIGLLGDKYIDISIGAEGEQALAENSIIPLRESFDLEAAGPQLKKALGDFTEVMGNAKRITASIERGEGSVGRIIKQPTVAAEMERFLRSLNTVMAAMEARQGTLGRLVYDESLSQNFTDVSANLKTVTDQIRQGKGTMGKLIMDDRLYLNLSSFTSRADSIMAKASNDSSNVSKLLNDGQFYNQIMSLMKDLNLLLVDLKEHPSKYVHVSVF